MTKSESNNLGTPLEPYNLFLSDPVLPAAIKREGGMSIFSRSLENKSGLKKCSSGGA